MINPSFIHKLRSFHFHKNSSQEKCLQVDGFNIGQLWYISISNLLTINRTIDRTASWRAHLTWCSGNTCNELTEDQPSPHSHHLNSRISYFFGTYVIPKTGFSVAGVLKQFMILSANRCDQILCSHIS